MADDIIGEIHTKYATIPIKDTDLWGLSCALIQGQMNGYFKGNEQWAEAMKNSIDELRFGKEEE